MTNALPSRRIVSLQPSVTVPRCSARSGVNLSSARKLGWPKVEAAGGKFVGPPGVQTTAEEVLREAPDVLVAAWCGAGDRVPLEKAVLQRGGWQDLPASKSGRVFCISDELLNTPAPTLVQGLQALAWAK